MPLPARHFTRALLTKATRVTTFHGHTVYPDVLDEQSVVLDLGANRGQFALEITQALCCRCHAVEAAPSLALSLDDTDRITVYHYAIASSSGMLTFNIHVSDDSSSLLTLPSEQFVEAVQVPSITLAQFISRYDIPRIDLVKMDIEGAETSVLDTASGDLLSRIGQLSVEFHDFNGVLSREEVRKTVSRLEKLGFFYVRFSRHGNQNVLLFNTRLHRLSFVERLYLKYIVRNALGFARVAKRALGRGAPH